MSGIGLYLMLHLSGDDDAAALHAWQEAWDIALAIIEKHDGAFGHHHGIGMVRSARYLATAEGHLHLRLKGALDEAGVMHSGLLNGLRVDRIVPAANVPRPHVG
jgi:FAD/FMN-containing dehydrogenase